VGPTGVEVPPETYRKTALSGIGGTETGTLAAYLALADLDLQLVIESWYTVSETTKVAILAMIQAAK